MKISVVMPVYNECWTIREIVRRVMEGPEPVFELIMVDDGSVDGTRDLIRGLEKKYAGHGSRLRVIFRERNGGKGAALVDGFAAAEGGIVVVQDADLEYSPEDYPKLVEPIRSGRADAVYGSRFMGGKRNVLYFWHSLANWLLTVGCNMVSNLNLTDVWTGYKVFRADLIKKIPLKSRGFDFEPEITVKLAKLGCRIYEVPVSYHGRGYAEGKKIGLKDAFIGVWATVSTALWGDLGDLAVGEQTLRIMAKAGRYNRFVYEQYRAHLGPRVVELGSGVGNVSRFLLDREKLLLTENEPAYLDLLKANFGGWGYIDIRPLDITAAPPRELAGAFDTAVCFNVIEHVEDDAAAVRTIGALLAPGGKAVLIVPAHQALYGSLDKHLLHFRRYDRAGFSALLEKEGFEIEEARYLNPVAVPGWWLNGKIFGRKVIPGLQLAFFDRLTPLVAWASGLGLGFGLSLFVVARKKA